MVEPEAAEHDMAAYLFQGFRNGWNGLCHDGSQFLKLCFQLAQEGVIGSDLPVQLAAVRGDALTLHGTGGNALVDSGSFFQTTGGMTAMVNALLMPRLLQGEIGSCGPISPPLKQLLLAVPA